jgi:Raf kinase inhibitor-like YbhB/YbcL family protein
MAAFVLDTGALEHGQPISSRCTCDGDDVSPPLRWGNVREEAQSLALLVDDPDAPRGVFTHWVAWALAGGAGALGEGGAAPGEGRNGFGTVGYRGPCQAPGHGPRRYFFASTRSTASPSSVRGQERPSWSRRSKGTC